MINNTMIKNYTDRHSEYGDYVVCSNCLEIMVVDTGEEICPSCNKSGVLAWMDEGNPEVYVGGIT